MVSRRKDKKMRKNLINKKALQYIIAHSNICRHGDYELRLAGYKPGQKNNPNSWMYEQVMEALAVFSSHGNSGFSAPFEINLVQKLCKFEPIAPLTLNDNEFHFIYIDDKGRYNYQNKRKSSIFKRVDKDGTIVIDDIDAFTKCIKYHKNWGDNEFKKGNNTTWSGGTWIVNKNLNFTGEYLAGCRIKPEEVETHKYFPKKTIVLNCYEIGADDGINGFTNFVLNDSPEFIQLCKQYELDTVHVESIKGDSVFDITPLDIDIAETELKNGRNNR